MMTDEEIAHIYHLGIELTAKISMLYNEDLAKLQSRFKIAATKERDEDSVAVRMLSNICQVYME